jgi:radical S-adenosyl methionine domain-containing protein 2
MKEIVINWHIIQKCNYKCNYCFAHYEKENKKEISRSKKDIEQLLKKVHLFFNSEYPKTSLRLNIAGGEPTLSKNIDFTIQKAHEIGFKVSLITNGSFVKNNFLYKNAKYLTMYALSIDSLESYTNLMIGREEKNKTLTSSRVFKQLETLRELNPNIKIKINTVVNEFNFQEELYLFINIIKPDKWKVLQALSINTSKIFCTHEQFKAFLKINNKSTIPLSIESNEDMTESYIMIDPYGRFYQNTNSQYYYSNSILNHNIKEEFNSLGNL